MSDVKNSKGTPSKDTGAKNNNSDNDVDYKNISGADNSSRTGTSNKGAGKGTK